MAKQGSKTTKKVVKPISKTQQERERVDKAKQESEKKYLEGFEYICLEIEKGFALRNVCKSFMSADKFHAMCEADSKLNERYSRACARREDSIFEDMLDIADSSNADLIVGEKGNLIIDGEAVQRSRLKIETRKWMLGKMRPKKYGERVEIEHSGEIKDGIDYTKLSDAALNEIANAKPE